MWILSILLLIMIMPITAVILFVNKKKKIALFVLLSTMVFNLLTESIPFKLPRINKNKIDFSVECFNIHSSGNDFNDRQTKIAKQILQQQPTFVYLTEYIGVSDPFLDTALKKRYKYSSCSFSKYLETERFYSKWQIDNVYNLSIDTLDSKVLRQCQAIPAIKSHLNRTWLYRVQIHENSDTIAIYCCHLETNNLGKVRDSFSNNGLNLLKQAWRFVGETRIGYAVRKLETDTIVKCLKNEHYPFIVMGDMNDISGSYAIRNLQKAGLKDAWWEKGFGYGCTFHDFGLRLRIDHILFDDKRLTLDNVKVLKADLSDHNAMTASFSFI